MVGSSEAAARVGGPPPQHEVVLACRPPCRAVCRQLLPLQGRRFGRGRTGQLEVTNVRQQRPRMLLILAFPVALSPGILLVPVISDYSGHVIAARAVSTTARWDSGHVLAAVAFGLRVLSASVVADVLVEREQRPPVLRPDTRAARQGDDRLRRGDSGGARCSARCGRGGRRVAKGGVGAERPLSRSERRVCLRYTRPVVVVR